MSRVITFSRTFPAYHPKAGKPTYFVEKFYNSLFSRNNLMDYPKGLEINDSILEMKHHTIRAGKRWKVGDKFSPRVWSGKPYNSKQIVIAPDIEIKKVWDIEIKKFADGWWIDFGNYAISEDMPYAMTRLPNLAKSDGLELQDLLDWFKFLKKFSGQIICWNESIIY